MICYKINGNLIEKYEVIYDKEKLKDLEKEVITNCSTMEHKDYKASTKGPHHLPAKEYIKNLKETFIKK